MRDSWSATGLALFPLLLSVSPHVTVRGREKATDQADRDREYFQQKWLFRVDDPTYSNIAVDLQFKGEV
jgi:hypothetical protein